MPCRMVTMYSVVLGVHHQANMTATSQQVMGYWVNPPQQHELQWQPQHLHLLGPAYQGQTRPYGTL